MIIDRHTACEPYVAAIQAGNAGRVTLYPEKHASVVKALLSRASKAADLGIRSAWEDGMHRVLYWKRVGA